MTIAETPDDLRDAAPDLADPRIAAAVAAGEERLSAFMHAFNARNAQAWAHTLNYPHVRLAGGNVRVWETPASYAASNDLHRFATTGWHHSRWDWHRPVQASADKVHFAVRFTRYDATDQPIESFEALYVVTRQAGRWGIQARSSYAGERFAGAAF